MLDVAEWYPWTNKQAPHMLGLLGSSLKVQTLNWKSNCQHSQLARSSSYRGWKWISSLSRWWHPLKVIFFRHTESIFTKIHPIFPIGGEHLFFFFFTQVTVAELRKSVHTVLQASLRLLPSASIFHFLFLLEWGYELKLQQEYSYAIMQLHRSIWN